MKFDKGCEILWKDRKRHLGLPISFYRYYIVKKEGEWVYHSGSLIPTTIVRDGAKVGRNDPCPCGSGLKYKRCCGR